MKNINKEVKRLNSEIYRISFEPMDKYYTYIETEARFDFCRIYELDPKFEYLNKESILIMLQLNLRHRFIPFHRFGNKIEIL
jgi:hypothetical protein